jgi:SAM-dependent methyltransferase
MEYEEKYHKKIHNFLINNSKYYTLRSRISLKRYFKDIKNLRKKRILEFGSGLGQNIFLLREGEVYGYDISKSANDFAKKKGIKIISSTTEIKDNFFDIILSCHNLEHLENPFENLKFLYNKLKKGGILILVLPTEKQKYSPLKPELVNNHLFAWNFDTINNLLFRVGFNVEKNKFYSGKGYSKFSFLSAFNFNLYIFVVSLVGKLTRSKDLFIVARR